MHGHHQFHIPSTQVNNIDRYIAKARVSACKYYMPKMKDRVQYEKCGTATTDALAQGDALCKAVGVNTDDYCAAAKTAVRS